MNHCQNLLRFALLCMMQSSLLLTSSVNADDNLQLSFSGEIKTLCQFNMQRQQDSLALIEKSVSMLPIALYCNQPMTLAITSENGGMKLKGSDNILPYTLSVQIPNAKIDTTVPSQELINTVQLNSKDIPYQADGNLHFTLLQSSAYAGRYQDTLTINLAPMLVVSP